MGLLFGLHSPSTATFLVPSWFAKPPLRLPAALELEPPVRVPHTVYVKSLYRIGGQDFCRHHIIRTAVAAGVIAEIRAGVASVAAATRGAPSTEYDRRV